jgi:GT2 family glycosyltransferase
MKVSLIISVYKDVENLRVVLESLKFQTYKEFEVVVSEDGEFEGMKTFLQSYQHPCNIIHITQPDVGWRKNQALNNAIRKCHGDYLIFIDGDCVLHHLFIENHIRYSASNRIVAGKRIKLGPEYSILFKKNIHQLPSLEKRIQREVGAVSRDGAKFYEEGFYINPDGLLGFVPRIRKMRQLKGCNMSFYRSAIEKINGFDEDYILPAIGEDIDLTWRFQGLGYELFSVRNLAIQYHLYHKENWTDQSENERLMAIKQKERKFYCDNGLNAKRGLLEEENSNPNFIDSTKQVLLFEFKFHEEVIPSQIKFLQSNGYQVHLFLERTLWDDSLFGCFPNLKTRLFKNSKHWHVKLFALFQMLLYVRKFKIKYIVVNTLDSTFGHVIIRFFSHLYKVGIAHQIGNVSHSKVYMMNVKRMQGILTLSTHTLKFFKKNYPDITNVSCFYPIFFCKESARPNSQANEIKIVIPGQLSNKRRDYQLLLDCSLKLKQDGSRIKFYLLGDAHKFDGPEIIKFIRENGLEKMFWFSTGRIPYNEFLQHISEADYVMPLLSTRVVNYKYYLESQISASFNWGLGLKKHLIIHHDFAHLDFSNLNAIVYGDDLDSKLLELNGAMNKPYIDLPQLNFHYQRKSYFEVFNDR